MTVRRCLNWTVLNGRKDKVHDKRPSFAIQVARLVYRYEHPRLYTRVLPCIGTNASPTSCRRALWHPIETSSPMSCNPPRSRSLQGRKGNIQQANMILQMLRWVYYLKVTSTHWLSYPTPPRTEAIRLSICPDLRFISSCMLYKGLKLTCYTL